MSNESESWHNIEWFECSLWYEVFCSVYMQKFDQEIFAKSVDLCMVVESEVPIKVYAEPEFTIKSNRSEIQ
jgi:hypothetical protein